MLLASGLQSHIIFRFVTKAKTKAQLKKKLCVTLINFLPIIKQVSKFLIKGELFLDRERERYTSVTKWRVVHLL